MYASFLGFCAPYIWTFLNSLFKIEFFNKLLMPVVLPSGTDRLFYKNSKKKPLPAAGNGFFVSSDLKVNHHPAPEVSGIIMPTIIMAMLTVCLQYPIDVTISTLSSIHSNEVSRCQGDFHLSLDLCWAIILFSRLALIPTKGHVFFEIRG